MGAAADCKFATVKTSCPTTCPPFVLEPSNLCFFDSIVQMQTQATGTPIEYWSQDYKAQVRDPLYDEPIQRVWRGPFKLKAIVEYTPSEAESREEGYRVTWNGSMFIARRDLEDAGAPPPNSGDVVRYWQNKFFAQYASGGNNDPGAGYYFDVVNVSEDQHIYDSAAFLGFTVRLARRTEFAPERRIGEG